MSRVGTGRALGTGWRSPRGAHCEDASDRKVVRGDMNDWQDAEQRVERAQEHFQRRQWEAALRELRAAIAINPHNAPWLFNLGMVLDEMGRFDEAADAYRKVLNIEPRDTRALNHLGVALHR